MEALLLTVSVKLLCMEAPKSSHDFQANTFNTTTEFNILGAFARTTSR